MTIRSTFKGATKDDKFYFGNFKPSEEIEKPIQSNEIPGEDELFF
jgi:hypothetical protein